MNEFNELKNRLLAALWEDRLKEAFREYERFGVPGIMPCQVMPTMHPQEGAS